MHPEGDIWFLKSVSRCDFTGILVLSCKLIPANEHCMTKASENRSGDSLELISEQMES